MTVLVTGRAVPAFFILLVRITWAAYIRLITSETVFAGVVFHVLVSDPGEYKMIPDLFWYGGRIFVQSLPNLGKRTAFIKHFLDEYTLFEWEMFLISHVSTSYLPGHSTNTISHEKAAEKDEAQEWNTTYKWIKIAPANRRRTGRGGSDGSHHDLCGGGLPGVKISMYADSFWWQSSRKYLIYNKKQHIAGAESREPAIYPSRPERGVSIKRRPSLDTAPTMCRWVIKGVSAHPCPEFGQSLDE